MFSPLAPFLFACLITPALADSVTWDIAGSIGYPNQGMSRGAMGSFAGSFTLDPETPDLEPAPGVGFYRLASWDIESTPISYEGDRAFQLVFASEIGNWARVEQTPGRMWLSFVNPFIRLADSFDVGFNFTGSPDFVFNVNNVSARPGIAGGGGGFSAFDVTLTPAWFRPAAATPEPSTLALTAPALLLWRWRRRVRTCGRRA